MLFRPDGAERGAGVVHSQCGCPGVRGMVPLPPLNGQLTRSLPRQECAVMTLRPWNNNRRTGKPVRLRRGSTRPAECTADVARDVATLSSGTCVSGTARR